MTVPVFLPYSIASNNNYLLFTGSLDLDDVRHARYWLLIERKSFDIFMTEISNRSCQIQSIYSSLDNWNSSLFYPGPFYWIFWLMIERQRNALIFLPKCRPRIPSISANDLFICDGNNNSCCACCDLGCKGRPIQLLSFIFDQFFYSWFQLHQQLDMNECLCQGLPNFSFIQNFPLREDVNEMSCYEFGDFSSTMAIEDSKQCDVLKARSPPCSSSSPASRRKHTQTSCPRPSGYSWWLSASTGNYSPYTNQILIKIYLFANNIIINKSFHLYLSHSLTLPLSPFQQHFLYIPTIPYKNHYLFLLKRNVILLVRRSF